VNFVRKAREEFASHTIMVGVLENGIERQEEVMTLPPSQAGSVVTGEMVEELLIRADIIKVGLGLGTAVPHSLTRSSTLHLGCLVRQNNQHK